MVKGKSKKKKPQNDFALICEPGSYVITPGRIGAKFHSRTGTKKRRVEVIHSRTFDHTGRALDITQEKDKSDRNNMRYRKRIVDSETGEVLRDDDKPLLEHTGHGAAKFKKKPMDTTTRATLHRDITEQVRTLIARAGHLRDTGKLDEARRLLVRIEKLTAELKGLEG